MNTKSCAVMRGLKSSVAAAAMILAAATAAQAGVFSYTLGEFNYDGDAPFPSPEQTVGTFNFSLSGPITSATLSGTFGNSEVGSSAGVDVYADGSLVAQCVENATCWQQGEAWSFTFSNFSSLLDGSLTISAIQTSEYITRLGATTLTIHTGIAVPGPIAGAGLPALMALGGFAWARRRKADVPAA